MKQHFLILAMVALLVASSTITTAQNTFPASGSVGIGTTTPNASAILEIQSTGKGLLIPRMTKAQREAIVAPANGLLIYQTNNAKGFYYYNGTGWSAMGKSGNAWLTGAGVPSESTGSKDDLYLDTLSGNYYLKTSSTIWTLQGNLTGPSGLLIPGTVAGNTPYWDGTNWIVSSGNIFNKGENVGIGTTVPASSAKLDVSSTTQGFLLPRMTTQQRNGIAAPAVGLQIYNLDTKLVEIYNGSSWGSAPSYTATGEVENTPASDSWVNKANFGGTGRTVAVGFSIGNKGYIGTGTDGSNKKDFWQYDPANDTWTQKADFGGTARSFAVGFSIGSKGYIGTGISGPSGFKNDFWEYDPATNAWTQKANFGGTARSAAVGFSIGNMGYIGMGTDGTNKSDFWQYDPTNNSWTQKANFGGTARFAAVGFSLGGKGYLGTGFDGVSNKNDFWEYDPATNGWIQKANFGGGPRANAVGFSVGAKGYIATGQDGGHKNDVWEYDPASNSWMQQDNFGGTARNGAVAFAIGSKTYIGTGYDGTYKKDLWEYGFSIPQQVYALALPDGAIAGPWITNGSSIYNINNGNVGIGTGIPAPSAKLDVSSTEQGFLMPRMSTQQRDNMVAPATGLQIYNLDLNLVEVYNGTTWESVNTYALTGDSIPLPGSDMWIQKADLAGTGRIGAVGFYIGNKGYIGTGNDGSNKKDFWEFDPVANAWSQKADFGGAARQGATGFSIGDKGYIGTGLASTWMKDFWEYDPATNSWTQKADFGGMGRLAAVGFSIGNKGYIGTGSTVGFPYLKDFWEYDPVTDHWTQKADFGGAALSDAVGFSIGTKGYIGTGSNADSPYLKDFWEYDPAANSWTQKADLGGTGRIRAVGFSIGSKGYIGTGYNSQALKDFWEYDPAADSWAQRIDFGGPARDRAVGFSIGNKGYIGTGVEFGAPSKKDFWEYNPLSDYQQVYEPVLPAGGITGFWIKNGDNIYNSNSGNVGIGTTIPHAPLQLANNTSNRKIVLSELNDNDQQFYGFGVNESALRYQVNTIASDHVFYAGASYTTSVELMRIKGTGRVGIGTSSPSGQFELSLDEGLKPSTSTWWITSDERLKNIDGDYSKGLKEIVLLHPIRYHYKNAGDRMFDSSVLSIQNVGFSAQEIQKVFPEAVRKDENGYLSFNMHPILVAQVNAISELNTKVDDMARLSGTDDSLVNALQFLVEKQQTTIAQQLKVNEDQQTQITGLNEKLNLLLNKLADYESSLSACCTQFAEKSAGAVNTDRPRLEQNVPNPFQQITYISFYIPPSAKAATLIITDSKGIPIKQFTGLPVGYGSVEINYSMFVSGAYQYTLFIDGKIFDTKLMILQQ